MQQSWHTQGKHKGRVIAIGLGYNDQKIIEAYDIVKAVATNTPVQPDVRFAYEVNKVIDAVLLSCEERRWVTV